MLCWFLYQSRYEAAHLTKILYPRQFTSRATWRYLRHTGLNSNWLVPNSNQGKHTRTSSGCMMRRSLSVCKSGFYIFDRLKLGWSTYGFCERRSIRCPCKLWTLWGGKIENFPYNIEATSGTSQFTVSSMWCNMQLLIVWCFWYLVLLLVLTLHTLFGMI